MPTIRSFLLISLFVLPFHAMATDNKQSELVLAGPGTLVSYPLFRMIETGALSDFADKVTFRHWQTPDQMRAMVISGQAHASAVPSNVAAMFYNRGEPVRLLNISVWGLLWLVSADPNLKSLADFKQKQLAIPFRNDMPDLMFRAVSNANDLPKESYQIKYVSSGMNAMQMLLAGRLDHAVLPEPAVSILLMRNQKLGKRPLYRALKLSELWADTFPTAPRIPQAGMMSTRALAQKPILRRAISRTYDEATQWCQLNIQACAQLAHKYLPQIPVDGAVQALTKTPLNSRPAAEAQGDLEAFFTRIAELDERKIGGKLPAEEFYQP